MFQIHKLKSLKEFLNQVAHAASSDKWTSELFSIFSRNNYKILFIKLRFFGKNDTLSNTFSKNFLNFVSPSKK